MTKVNGKMTLTFDQAAYSNLLAEVYLNVCALLGLIKVVVRAIATLSYLYLSLILNHLI